MQEVIAMSESKRGPKAKRLKIDTDDWESVVSDALHAPKYTEAEETDQAEVDVDNEYTTEQPNEG